MDAPANEDQEGLENNAADPEFIGEEEAESEEISLDEEPASGRINQAGRGREAAAPTTQIPDEAGEAATDDTDVPSPSDLAETDGVWQMAGEWNVDLLQRGDQPFLVRHLPPQLLDRYCLCLLAPLYRLQKYPTCPGGWTILHFLPRLTLRPALEPVTGSRWAIIEARLHKFQRGEWEELFEEAGVIPATEGPIRHQDDEEGVCARAEGLMKKVQLGVAVPGGAECVIHAVRALLREDKTRIALQLDVENAFNSVERQAFLGALQWSNLSPLLPLVRNLYDGPSRLLVDPRLGTDHILSTRGVRQSDPLGPLLFAAAIQPALLGVAASVPEVAIMAYADDITVVGPPEAACLAFNSISGKLAELGLRCNFAKSSAWTPSEGGDNDGLPKGLVANQGGIKH
ncbi:unnamed protein product [Closterium sp. Naga37s-1]|nr:unnamed protein product [Closterium sp. Naga37s-1]